MTGKRLSEYALAMLVGMFLKTGSWWGGIFTLIVMALDVAWIMVTHPELTD